jgi:hypothetical protein
VQVNGDGMDACLPDPPDEMPQKRAIQDRHKRLGKIRREWAQPASQASC